MSSPRASLRSTSGRAIANTQEPRESGGLAARCPNRHEKGYLHEIDRATRSAGKSKVLLERGFNKPVDAEVRLDFYAGQLGL